MATGTITDKPVRAASRCYRVLHVLDHSWPVMSGYSVRSRSLVRAQYQLGFAPQVVTGPLHELDDAQSADSVVDELRYLRTPLRGGLSSRAIAGRWPLLREAAVVRVFRQRILEILKSESFDVVHAHSPALCGLAAHQAARGAGLPFVYEIRAFWEDAAVDQDKTQQRALRYRVSRRMETHVVENADAVVGIARHILVDLEGRGIGRDKLFHVSNGVDTERFVPLPRDSRLASELRLDSEVVFGFAGSLYKYEGVSWLVQAVAELRRRGTACRLLILGDGEDVPAIKAAIDEKGAGDYIHFLGRVPHDQMQRYYSVIDVAVYPRKSIRLTELVTPLKPLETMSQGKAVLGSAVGGIAELVEHEKTGLLFKPEDVDDFCVQAKRLAEQPGLRKQLGIAARETMQRQRDWKVVARQYESVYDFATAQHAGRKGN